MRNDATWRNAKEKQAVRAVLPWLLSVVAVVIVLLLAVACATPHSPTRVLPKSPPGLSGIDSNSGYVYDELLSAQGLTLDEQGKISAVSPQWAKTALGRVLDLQQALDDCQAERRQLLK